MVRSCPSYTENQRERASRDSAKADSAITSVGLQDDSSRCEGVSCRSLNEGETREAVWLRTVPGKWPHGCGVRSTARLLVAGNVPVGAVECRGLSGLDQPVTARRSVRRGDGRSPGLQAAAPTVFTPVRPGSTSLVRRVSPLRAGGCRLPEVVAPAGATAPFPDSREGARW
jgi:hypothetical protein